MSFDKIKNSAKTARVDETPSAYSTVVSVRTGSSVNSFNAMDIMDSSFIEIVFTAPVRPGELSDLNNWYANTAKPGQGSGDDARFYQLSSYEDWNSSVIVPAADSLSVRIYLKGSAQMGDGTGNTGDIHGIAFQAGNLLYADGTPLSSTEETVYFYADPDMNGTAGEHEVADGISPVFLSVETVWLDNADSVMALGEFAVRLIFSEKMSGGNYAGSRHYRIDSAELDSLENDGNPLIYDKTDISVENDSVIFLKPNYGDNKFTNGNDTPVIDVMNTLEDSYGNPVSARSITAMDRIAPHFLYSGTAQGLSVRNVVHSLVVSAGSAEVEHIFQANAQQTGIYGGLFGISAADSAEFRIAADANSGVSAEDISVTVDNYTFSTVTLDSAGNYFSVTVPVGNIISSGPGYSLLAENTLQVSAVLRETSSGGANTGSLTLPFRFILDTSAPESATIDVSSLTLLNQTASMYNDTLNVRNNVSFTISSTDADIVAYRMQVSADASGGTWYDMDVDPPGDTNGDNAPGILGIDDNNDGIVDGVDLNGDGIMDIGGITIKDDDNENGVIDEDYYFAPVPANSSGSTSNPVQIHFEHLYNALTALGASGVKTSVDNGRTVFIRAVPYDRAGNSSPSKASVYELKINRAGEADNVFRTELTELTPGRNSVNSFSGYPIRITAAWPLDAASVTADRVFVQGEYSGPDSGVISLNNDNKSINFTRSDSKEFLAGEKVTVSLSDSVQSDGLNRTADLSYSFHTSTQKTEAQFILSDSLALDKTPVAFRPADFNRDGYIDFAVIYANTKAIDIFYNNGQNGFSGKTTLSPVSIPEYILSADVNKDYYPDLIVANFKANSFSVLLNKGGSGFTTPASYSTGAGPAGLAVGDINGDGWPDIAVSCSGEDKIGVYFGSPGGTFALNNTLQAGNNPVRIDLSDYNNDGSLDMAVVNLYSNNLSVFSGSDTGEFTALGVYTVGNEPYSLRSADFTGDGYLDIIIGNQYDDTISLLINSGSGSFTEGSALSAGDVPIHLHETDFNGDGYLDVVAANFNGKNLSLLRGKGNGLFTFAGYVTVHESPANVFPLDFDRDGDADLLVLGRAAKTIQVFKNANAQVSAESSISFGDITTGASLTKELTITNSGPVNVTIDMIATNQAVFITQLTTLSITSGGSAVLPVTFSPPAPGEYADTLSLRSSTYSGLSVKIALSGRGIVADAPEITINDTLDFLSVNIGNQMLDSLKVANTGGTELIVGSIVSDNAVFVPQTASLSIDPGEYSYIPVLFTPTAVSAYTGILSISSNDPVYPVKQVTLKGGGAEELEPEIVLSDSNFNFGGHAIGMSDTILFTITNQGSKTLTIDSIVFSQNVFSAYPGTPVSVSGNNAVSIMLVFSPAAEADYTAAGKIYSNDPDRSTYSITLEGSGIDPLNPPIQFSTDTLRFVTTDIGDSMTADYTITNTGNSPVTIIKRITDSPVFFSPDKPVSLKAGGSAELKVVFKPRSTLAKTGNLIFSIQDGTVYTAKLPLKGAGKEKTVADLSASFDSVDFGFIFLGQTKDTVLTIVNRGAVTLEASLNYITNNVFTTNFSSVTLSPGQSRSYTVSFAPTKISYEQGSIFIRSNDPVDSLKEIMLEGEGIEVYAPQLTIAPPALAFGAVKTDSAVIDTLKIANTGTGALNITNIVSDNEAVTVSATQFELKTGESASVFVTFAPAVVQQYAGTISFYSNDSSSPEKSVSYNGTGTQFSGANISVEPLAFDFGDVYLQDTAVRVFTVHNTGTEPLTVISVGSSNKRFSLNKSTFLLQPMESDSVTVSFMPENAGPAAADITILSNAVNSPEVTVSVSGTGIILQEPRIDVDTGPVEFGAVEVGGSVSKALAVANTGTESLVISLIKVYNPVFTTDVPYLEIPAGQQKSIILSFTPVQEGAASSQLRLLSNAVNAPEININLIGAGVVYEYQDTITVIPLFSSVAGDNARLKMYENASMEFSGFTGSLEVLNGGMVFFPLGSLDHNASLIIKALAIPADPLRFYAKKGIIGATVFELSSEGKLIQPKKPVRIRIPFDLSLAQKIGLPEQSLIMAVLNEEGMIDTTGITMQAVETGNGFLSAEFSVFGTVVITGRSVLAGTYIPPPMPVQAQLYQNYPNPFNPVTTIRFDVASNDKVEITIYDLLGKPVKMLTCGAFPPGTYSVQWDGSDESGRKAASGVYFCRLITAEMEQTTKMILLK